MAREEPTEPDDGPLDLSRVSPEQLEALRALLENLITQQDASPGPDPAPRYCHSSHSSAC